MRAYLLLGLKSKHWNLVSCWCYCSGETSTSKTNFSDENAEIVFLCHFYTRLINAGMESSKEFIVWSLDGTLSPRSSGSTWKISTWKKYKLKKNMIQNSKFHAYNILYKLNIRKQLQNFYKLKRGFFSVYLQNRFVRSKRNINFT